MPPFQCLWRVVAAWRYNFLLRTNVAKYPAKCCGGAVVRFSCLALRKDPMSAEICRFARDPAAIALGGGRPYPHIAGASLEG
jgi:hypothetical protein